MDCRRFANRTLVAVTLSLFCPGGPAALAQGSGSGSDGLAATLALEQSLTQVIEQAEPSVVSIARLRPMPGTFEMDGRLLQRAVAPSADEGDPLPNQFAAGVIVAPTHSEERLILTAYHAVRGGPTTGKPGSGDGSILEVRLSSRHHGYATIFAADPRSDLAVLKINPTEFGLRAADLRPLSWATNASVRKGQLVVILGNAYWIARDGSPSAAWGMVSNLARRPAALLPEPGGPQTLNGLGGLIHLDYRLPIGSSGSPVLNMRGELVGLASSLAAIEGYERSGGFATPIDPSTRWIIDTLLAGYEVEYGFLGVRPGRLTRWPNVAIAEGPRQASAAIAVEVHQNSPAALAGVRPDDIIIAVDGQPTLTDLDLMRQVTLHPPETAVKLTVLRPPSYEPTNITIKTGKWPVSDEEGIIASQSRHPRWRGLQVDYSTGRAKYMQLAPPQILPGVVITDVAADSPAQAANLKPGMFITQVNRVTIRSPGEFQDAVRAAKGPVALRMQSLDSPPRTVTIGE